MKICRTILEIRQEVGNFKRDGQRIGLVPTMGFLHEGHLALMREARQACGKVVVSIFVNPTQFGPHEDYQNYPKDLDRDLALCQEVGVDIVFTPSVSVMYPKGSFTKISVGTITDCFCGLSRPGHFDGVATVVAKLFNIIQPDSAFFGWKDAQQVLVIKQMTADLNMPVEIIAVPTVREPDGLAKSSRNVYLNEAERKAAVVLYQSLSKAREAVAAGERDPVVIEQIVRSTIEAEPLARIDYIGIRKIPTLKKIDALKGEALLALAVYFGKARLIDNTILEV